MPEVFVGVGSNVDPLANIRKAIGLLSERYGELTISPAYQTRAIGFEGDDFVNLVIAFHSGATTSKIRAELADIETECGRTRDTQRFGPRTLDLDLLLYGNEMLVCNGVEIPRAEILKYAFVLKPLSDIAEDKLHPQVGKSYGALWRTFSEPGQDIQPLEVRFG